MRIAIPEWRGRVSPVFDVAGKFLLIDVESGREVRREARSVSRDSAVHIGEFLNLGAGALICGAISAAARARLVASGMDVTGFVCGKVNEVLNAYLNGELEKGAFAMPGCRMCARQEGERAMPGGFGMGAGRGGGRRRQGRGHGFGTGKMGGSFAAGAGGFCLCQKCGEKTPHSAGQPCVQMTCPKCGAPMIRS